MDRDSKKEMYLDREPRFPDVDWYCDYCGAYLNSQVGFDDHKYTWKCTECGGKNSISKDNIRKTNFAFFNWVFDVLDVLRTIAMHWILVGLILQLIGYSAETMPMHLTIPAIAYPVLLVIMLFAIVAGHYHDVAFLSLVFETILGDIIRPYREVLSVGNVVFTIRNHSRKRIVVWNILKLIIYLGVIVAELGLLVHACNAIWGSVGAAARAAGDWLRGVDNLRKLYVPFIIFAGGMSVITFLAFGIDKYYAVRYKWRVKEPTLFTLSVLFGAIGAVPGMLVFRHKINKPGFRVLIPMMAILQLVIIIWASIRYAL